jgi:hypothetical protein
MSDNNVIHFSGKRVLKLGELNQTVLIVRPDGTKLRGSDMRPVNDLPRDELIKIIDLLCERIAR